MIDEKELLYGAATTDNQVKFAFGSGDEKFAVAAGQANGVLSFVAGENGGAVYVGGSLVSSKVLSYAVSTNASTGEQVVDVRYIDANNAVATAQVLAVNASFVEGKVNALKTALEGELAETDAKTLAALNDRIDSVQNIAEGQSYSLHQITPSGANVKEEYQLFVGDAAVENSSTIKIYKDSALKSAELEVVDGKDTLVLTYINSEGVDTSVGIDVADFLRESEFKDGLKLENGQVSVKIDANSESYLTVGEGGVKLAGVADAIAGAVSAEDTSIKNYVDPKFEAIATAQGNQDSSIAANAAAIADVSTKVANLDATYVSETELNTYKGDVSTAISTAVSTEDTSIKNYVDSKFEAIATAQANQDASIKANADAIAALNDTYVSETELNTYKGEVSTAIATAVSTEDTSIKNYVDPKFEAITTAQGVQDGSIAANTAAIEAITTAQGVQDGSIAANTEAIEAITTAQGVQDGSIAANTEDIAENSSAIEAINDTLTWIVL